MEEEKRNGKVRGRRKRRKGNGGNEIKEKGKKGGGMERRGRLRSVVERECEGDKRREG